MFPNIKDDDVIFCNKSNYRRINMVVSVGGVEKNVSIKTGSSSVVYKDYLFSFITHFYVPPFLFFVLLCLYYKRFLGLIL